MARPGLSGSVLCVDDDPLVTSFVCRVLRQEGYSVSTASTGRLALDLASSMTFDVLLLDERLPDISGIAFVAAIREKGLKLPVIMMTGYASLDLAFAAGARGIRAFMAKPFDANHLVSAVRSATEARQVRAALPRLQVSPGPSEVVLTVPRSSPLFAELDQIGSYGCLQGTGAALAAPADLARALATPAVGLLDFIATVRVLRATLKQPRPSLRALNELSEQQNEWISRVSRTPVHERLLQLLAEIATSITSGNLRETRNIPLQSLLSRNAVNRLLRRQLELTYRDCHQAVVVRRAILELSRGTEHIDQIAYALGYEHPAAFSRQFSTVVGVSPKGFRALLVSVEPDEGLDHGSQ